MTLVENVEFKVCYEVKGDTVRCDLFIRTLPTQTWSMRGNFTFTDNHEWEAFYRDISGLAGWSYESVEESKA